MQKIFARKKALQISANVMSMKNNINSDSGSAFTEREQVKAYWEKHHVQWEKTAQNLVQYLEQKLTVHDVKYTIKSRVKSLGSFYKKYLTKKSNDPQVTLEKITDSIGIRIICPFLEILHNVESLIQEEFSILEIEKKGYENSFKEFGYQSTHYLIRVPEQWDKSNVAKDCCVAEIQVRTILQEAWAEVEHELIYKSEFKPYSEPLRRKLAALNANLTISDILFQELRDYQKNIEQRIQLRRDSFHDQIHTAFSLDEQQFLQVDHESFEKSNIPTQDFLVGSAMSGLELNDLLIQSLNAHNAKEYRKAMVMYSHILERNPEKKIQSIIFTHRGMAYFSLADYEKAIIDFSTAHSMDQENTRPLYYRGLAYQVLKKYNDSLIDLNLCLEKDPTFFDALLSRAQIFFHLQDFAQAISECENILQIYPDNEKVTKFLNIVRHRAML